MAVVNRTDIDLQDTSETCTVPNDPVAKLMYYLNCMCSVLQLDDDPDINALRNYNNYYQLGHVDRNVLVNLCMLLNPRNLLNRCIFQVINVLLWLMIGNRAMKWSAYCCCLFLLWNMYILSSITCRPCKPDVRFKKLHMLLIKMFCRLNIAR